MKKKWKRTLGLISIMVFMVMLFAPIGTALAVSTGPIDSIVDNSGNIKVDGSKNFDTSIQKSKQFVNVIVVFVLIGVFIAFVIAWGRVAAAQGRGADRASALKDVFWVLISAAGIGGSTVIFAIFYNFFQ